MDLIWEQEVAGSNPAIPTGTRCFSNLSSIAEKPLWEPFRAGLASPDVALRSWVTVDVSSDRLALEFGFYSVRPTW